MKLFTPTFLGLVFLFQFGTVSAQDAPYLSFSYSNAIAFGEMSNFTNEYSFRGFQADFRYPAFPKVQFGASVAWNILRGESDGVESETIERDQNTVTVTARQYRFVNATPLMFNGFYYFGNSVNILPYAGLGLGVNLVERRVEMGLYRVEDRTGQFCLSPIAGVLIPTRGNTMFHVEAKGIYSLEDRVFAAHSYVAINAGLTFQLGNF